MKKLSEKTVKKMQVGNYFNCPREAVEEAMKTKIKKTGLTRWYARIAHWSQEVPAGAYKIGFYKVRQGDPSSLILLAPR